MAKDEVKVPTLEVPAPPDVPTSTVEQATAPDVPAPPAETNTDAPDETIVEVKAPWEVPAPFPVNDPQVPAHIEGAIPTPAAPEVLVVEKVKTDMVTVTVPQGFELTIDHNTTITIKPGIQEMDKAHANHWYAIANGVVIYEPKASE